MSPKLSHATSLHPPSHNGDEDADITIGYYAIEGFKT
jgi:hypothetical protein